VFAAMGKQEKKKNTDVKLFDSKSDEYAIPSSITDTDSDYTIEYPTDNKVISNLNSSKDIYQLFVWCLVGAHGIVVQSEYTMPQALVGTAERNYESLLATIVCKECNSNRLNGRIYIHNKISATLIEDSIIHKVSNIISKSDIKIIVVDGSVAAYSLDDLTSSLPSYCRVNSIDFKIEEDGIKAEILPYLKSGFLF
jgi:hypothetical protein